MPTLRFPALRQDSPRAAHSDPWTHANVDGLDADGVGKFIWKVRPEGSAMRGWREGHLTFEEVPAEMTVTGKVEKAWPASAPTTTRVAIDLVQHITTETVQRFNRAVDGSGIEVGKYHRTGGTAMRVPRPGGKSSTWVELPASIALKRAPAGVEPVWEVVNVTSKGVRVTIKPVVAKTASITSRPRKARKAPGASVATKTALASSEPLPARSVAPAASGSLKVKSSDPHRADPTGLFKFPGLKDTSAIVIEREVLLELDLLWAKHLKGEREVIALTGPTGTGKTSLAMGLAARHGVGVFKLDVAGNREFSDWTGLIQSRDGETKFIFNGFLQAVDADGRYAGIPRIVILDEANRAMSSSASNALLAVTDGFNSLWVPDLGRAVNLDPAVLFVMTFNRGSQYTGTNAIDLALSDRITSWYEMGFLDATREVALILERADISEEQAGKLVQAATQVRLADARGELPEGGGISIRRILEAASKVAAGFTLHAAAKRAWAGAYSAEGGMSSEQAIVNNVIDGVLR